MRTFIDAPFFSHLRTYKLEKAGLSEKPISINGYLEIPSNQEGFLKLNSNSFLKQSFESSSRQFVFEGEVINKNTFFEFKNLDKREFINEITKALAAKLRSEPTVASLTKFTLLTFADLKKYKFYYWFIFPHLDYKLSFDNCVHDVENSLDVDFTEIKANHSPIVALQNGKPAEFSPNADAYLVEVFDNSVPFYVHNLVLMLSVHNRKSVKLFIRNRNKLSSIDIDVPEMSTKYASVGYERNSVNKLSPKLVDLSALMNPEELAKQAVDLNLKLMKWRVSTELNLDIVSGQRCLLLGAGTLGTYIARGLMAWNVHKITFVDNGNISYSNPVRQSLYRHQDCIDGGSKAELAAKELKQIYPGVDSEGINMEILMAGHPVINEDKQKKEFYQLLDLINTHDTVFLLMDSREARWLPTLLCSVYSKNVVNVALGFDSFVVMRHSSNLGCYFCNDVVAPQNSLLNRPLDQMCTVTRPGLAMIASGYAVELMAQYLQHPDQSQAPLNASTCLGDIYHQLRGFLNSNETLKIHGQRFENCSACGTAVKEAFKQDPWGFIKLALDNPAFLNEVSGLSKLHEDADNLELDFSD